MSNPLSPGSPGGRDRRPRRKETPYRLTPARRAAARRNLRKATLARMLEWYPRTTPPEARARSLGALEKARASPAALGNATRHGLYSALLPAALRRAGESLEFNAHLERFERAFGAGPSGEAPPDDESRLIRAAAELVWRHIRAYRGQGEWERARLSKLLGRLDGYRIPSVQQATDLALQLVEILSWGYGGLAVPLGRLRRRLEDVFRDLYIGRFGWDPQFRIFRRGLHQRSELEGKPMELVGCPALPAWRVSRVKENEEKVAPASREAAGPGAVSRFFHARREDGARLLKLFGRIFLGTEPPAGSRLERATHRLTEAVAWRLQPFPRQAQWQAERAREIIERAGKSAPLTSRRMYVTMRRILELFLASDNVFLYLPRYDAGVHQALQECVGAAYGRRAAGDPLAALSTPDSAISSGDLSDFDF